MLKNASNLLENKIMKQYNLLDRTKYNVLKKRKKKKIKYSEVKE